MLCAEDCCVGCGIAPYEIAGMPSSDLLSIYMPVRHILSLNEAIMVQVDTDIPKTQKAVVADNVSTVQFNSTGSEHILPFPDNTH